MASRSWRIGGLQRILHGLHASLTPGEPRRLSRRVTHKHRRKSRKSALALETRCNALAGVIEQKVAHARSGFHTLP